MKRKVFRLIFLSLLSFSTAHGQDDMGDDEFFEDEEAIVDPADEFIPPNNPNDSSPRPRFGGANPRASGGTGGAGGNDPAAGGLGTTPEGAVVFRLVDPPQFKRPRTPTRIPYAIRKKVEERLKQETSE